MPALARGAGATLFVIFVGALWLVAFARPAAAHTVGGVGPTNYHTTLTGNPVIPGVHLSVVENGSRVRLVATAGFPIVVEGYEKEPYLRLDAEGVWENRRSSATYLNDSRSGDDPGPADVVDSSAPADWVRVAAARDGRVEAFWHDHRVHWMGSADPPAVRASPDRRHRIQDWSVPLTVSGRDAFYTGTLEWIPGPSPLPWAAATIGMLAGTAALGLTRLARWPLAAVLAGLVAVDATHSALIAAANADGRLDAFFWGNAVQIAVWLGALAGAVLIGRRSVTGLYLAVSSGMLLAVLGGLPDLGVFVRSGTPTVGPVVLARVLTAVTLGVGVGLALAGWLTLRRHPEASGSSGSSGSSGASGSSGSSGVPGASAP